MGHNSVLGVLWILAALCVFVAAEKGTSVSKTNKTAVSDSKVKKLGGNPGFPSSFVALSGSDRTISKDAGSEGSASVQKVTRQIFPEDEPSRVRDDQRRPASSTESVEEKPTRTKKPSRPREEFDGFPADFTDGLKPFRFQSSKNHQDAPTSGFVDFPTGDFSSLASTLGGLEPFAPLSSSASTTRGSSNTPSSGEATESGGRHFSPETSSESFRSASGSKRPEADRGFPQRGPTFEGGEFPSEDDRDQFAVGKGGRGRQPEPSSAEEKQIQAPPGKNDFGGADFAQFEDSRFSSQPNSFSKRPTKGSENPSAGTSSSDRESPNSNFRDLNQFQLGAPQNFVPVAHFHNGQFFPQQFGFRSPQEAQSPPVRSFRHVAPPQFFITSGGHFDGNGFFENGGGSAPDFSRGPTQNFHRGQPQFHFQSPQHSHQSHRSHQRQPHTNFHSDDTTTHHSSATSNILGSGNFGIIRGGIFADDENPPQSFGPQFRGGSDDFFHGFRDFQPYGGQLNNALSNIQNAGSKAQAVTAQAAASSSDNRPVEAKMTATAK